MSRLARARVRVRRFLVDRTVHRAVALLAGEALMLAGIASLSAVAAVLLAGVQLAAWAVLSDDGKPRRRP